MQKSRLRFGRSAAIAGTAALVLYAAQGAAAATMFSIEMDASQEVGTGSTSTGTATGTATLTQDGGGNHLSFEILFDSTFDFTGVGGGGGTGSETATALHFHDAPRGANGGVVFGMIGPNNDTDGDLSFSASGGGTLVVGEWDSGEGNAGADLDDFVAALLAANAGDDVPLYVNLHTSAFGGGSIRGQVVAVPEPASALLLLGGLLGVALRRRAS